jgi:F-type H+-transporting ATPase subunit b
MMNFLNTLAAAGAEVATEAAGHAEESSEGIGALGLSVPALIASAITFLVLFYVIKKYALDGIVANLEKRENDINRGLHLTAELDKQKAELEQTVEAELKKARLEADVIISEAKQETTKMIQSAEEKANNRADEILKAAEGKIERDISTARQDLKGEMATLITEATEAILNQKLDASGDQKLVENYLKEAMK